VVQGYARLAPPGTKGAAQLEATRMDVLGGEIIVGGLTHHIHGGDMYLQHMYCTPILLFPSFFSYSVLTNVYSNSCRWESAADWLPYDPNQGWDWAWGIVC
jgi:hypothetical protein